MARTTKKKSRKKTVTTARRKVPTTALKRTSMWLGEDLLAASAKEAKRLGVSRALWVQITLRKALGMPALNLDGAPEPDNSVFA